MERVGALAAAQWGLITSAQAADLGVPVQYLARLAHAGLLERYRHGVYRVGGAPADPLMELRAAWLSLAPARPVADRLTDPSDGMVSHRSAAAVHRLGDLASPRLEFTTAVRKQTRDPAIGLHRRALVVGEWTVVDGLPVTTVLTTIADLATEGIDGGHLAGVVGDAIAGGRAEVEVVAGTLAPIAHRYGMARGDGRGLLAELLAQHGLSASTHAVMTLLAERAAQDTATRGDSLQRTLAVMAGQDPEPLPEPPLLQRLSPMAPDGDGARVAKTDTGIDGMRGR